MRWFLLEGVSFTILSNDDRDTVLNDFVALIASVKKGILLMRREQTRFSYHGYETDVNMIDFYIGADVETIPYFNSKPIDTVPRPKISKLVNPYTLLLSNNLYARVLVAYRFPAYLPEGFLYSVFDSVSEIALIFRTIERNKAISMVERARKRKISSDSIEVQEQTQVLEELVKSIFGGADLVEFYLLLTITSRDIKELNSLEKHLKAILKGVGIEVEAPPMQKDLYNFNVCSMFVCIEKTYTDTYSLKPLFFLIDEELHDNDGVFLGVSGTGSPVLLDVWSKPNMNFVIVGVSGSGKSMTTKVYLKRLRELDKSILYVGVDPESEYTKVASVINAYAVEIHENQRLGLDPIRLMREGALELTQVADILTEIYGIPEHLHGVLRKELFLNMDFANNIVDFVGMVRDKDLSRYLQGATVPPDSMVYEGSPPHLAGSVVFGLKNVKSRRLKILISALISAYAYNKLLTKSQKSVFFVDEAWLFMETPSIVGLFENIARRGRKHGVAFIYISQMAEDLAGTPQGRTILEQSATVLLLRQEPQGRDAVKQIYKLSDSEANFLTNAPNGTGILKSGRKRITLHVLPTEEELQMFSTSPPRGGYVDIYLH
ncbi:MAG: DUF87 domain-containing protein [Ignisphaera sp.]